MKRKIVTLPREPAVEAALSWACQNAYAYIGVALDQYVTPRNLTYEIDGMYAFITFREKQSCITE